MRVELLHVTYALAVADRGSFSRAASTLGIDQATVSRAVKRIEDTLGVSLFERDSAGARLTHAGTAFLGRARIGLQTIEDAIADALAAGRGEVGVVAVGIASAVVQPALTILIEHARAHRGVAFRPVEDTSDRLLTRLFNRTVDIAIVMGALADTPADRMRLWTERLYLAVGDGVLPEVVEASWRDTGAAPLLCSRWRAWADLKRFLEARGHPVDLRPLECSPEAVLAYVAAGEGLTVVPESTARTPREGIRFLPILDEMATAPVCAVWLPENDNPALRRFISALREQAA